MLLTLTAIAAPQDEFDFGTGKSDGKVDAALAAPLPLTGKVKTTAARQVGEQQRWIDFGPTFYAILDYYNSVGQFYLEGSLKYNGAYRLESDSTLVIKDYELVPLLRELYWKRLFGPLTLSAGSELIVWSVGDLLPVADRLAVTDQTRAFFADPEDVRYGQYLIRMNGFLGMFKIDVVMVPFPQADIIADGEHPYSITPGVWLAGDTRPQNLEAAGKWSADFEKASLSLFGGRTNNRFPILEIDGRHRNELKVNRRYEPYYFIGGNYIYALDPVLFKAEMVLDPNRPMQRVFSCEPTGFSRKTMLNAMIGLDVNTGNLGLFTGELSIDASLEGYEDLQSNREVYQLAIGWSRSVLNDTLDFSATTIFLESTKNIITRFEAGYNLLDNFRLLCRYTTFSIGSPGKKYKTITDYDRFDIQLEYSF